MSVICHLVQFKIMLQCSVISLRESLQPLHLLIHSHKSSTLNSLLKVATIEYFHFKILLFEKNYSIMIYFLKYNLGKPQVFALA